MSDYNDAIIDYCLALADDSLILGHRLSEWCRNGPFLEEDLALTNTALDFIGRARMFYAHAAELDQQGRNEDDFAYLRDCREYRNFLINELPNGDFAFTMARQFMVDSYDMAFYTKLQSSTEPAFSAIAAKVIKESRYHLRRSRDWVIRLGDGTAESHERIQRAFEQLWGYTAEMFEMPKDEHQLVQSGIAVDRSALREEWLVSVLKVLDEATLKQPDGEWSIGGGRNGIHSEHLGYLLAEMQYLQRAYPGLQW